MANRKTRAQTARNTLEILKRGGYTSPSGQKVTISGLLQYAQANSVHYKPEMFKDVFETRNYVLKVKAPRASTEFEVINSTTLAAALREKRTDALCLNFASAKHPGGGFLKGSQAQEESLARASGLYPCIAQMKGMYASNRRFRSCLYTDDMIYAPKVPVFRNDADDLLDVPYCLSIITAPAVNTGAVIRNEPHNAGKIERTMLRRIEKILSVAVIHNHETLILGAWGCGVFRNNPVDVARWFYEQLIGNERFNKAFAKVVFAILDRTRNQAALRAFGDKFHIT